MSGESKNSAKQAARPSFVPLSYLHGIDKYKDVVDSHGSGKVWVRAENSAFLPTQLVDIVYTPTTSVAANAFTVNNNFDVRITNFPGIIRAITLDVQFTETGGSASVTPANPNAWFNRIETWENNGGVLTQNMIGDIILYHFGLFDTEQYTMLSSRANMGSNYTTNTAIAASGTYDYLVPLFGQYLDQVRPYMGFCTEKILRFWTQNAVNTGTGVLGLTSFKVHVLYDLLDDYNKAAYESFLKSRTIEVAYPDYLQQNFTQTFSASTQYQLLLNSFYGTVLALWAGFRSSVAPGGTNLQTYTALGQLSTIGHLNQSGVNMDGSSDSNCNMLRYIRPVLDGVNSSFLTQVPLYPIFWSKPWMFLKKGKVYGCNFYTGQQFVRPFLDASWSSGAYTLSMTAMLLRHVHIKPDGTTLYFQN